MANQINLISNLLNNVQGQSQTQQSIQQGLPTSMNDPRMSDAIAYVQNHGGNPKQAFMQLCKEKMVNPMEIMNRVMGNQM